MDRWQGRVAVVTGASAGIGASIAEELVKKGLNVVGLARRVNRIQELADKLRNESGKLHALKCDVTKEEEIKEAFQWVFSNLGGIHILVNNAGIAKFSNLITGPTEYWKQIMDLNVLGLSICTSEALQIMTRTGIDDGHIIHINSIAGHTMPNTSLAVHMYGASKHAVTVLTEGLRRELVNQKSKIRVTSISPGLVASEFLSEFNKTMDSKDLFGNTPHLLPKDIADCVIYALATPPHVQIHEIIVKPVGEEF